MFRNYLKVAIRNLSRHKVFSFINIVGLAFGIAVSLTISLWIQDELSYDNYHEKSNQIYRLAVSGVLGNEKFNTINTAAPTAKVAVNEFHEIQQSTRLLKGWSKQISAGERIYSESNFHYADANFFQVFTFPLLIGNPRNALQKPNSIVITQSTAYKYFDNKNPLGEVFHSDEGRDYFITGVCDDVPSNSHFTFDFIASLNTFDWSENNNWLTQSFATYIVVDENCNIDSLNNKFEILVTKYVNPQIKEHLGFSMADFDSTGQEYKFILQPLQKIHLHSHLDGEFEQNGNYSYVFVFFLIAAFILTIACINFMNLSTARSASRAKEIGIRKALGSSRKQLVVQFLTESVTTTFLALILSFAIIELILPAFNQLAGKNLEFLPLSKLSHFPVFIFLVFLIGLISGSYPAYHER